MTVSRFDPLRAVLFPGEKVARIPRFRKFINQKDEFGISDIKFLFIQSCFSHIISTTGGRGAVRAFFVLLMFLFVVTPVQAQQSGGASSSDGGVSGQAAVIEYLRLSSENENLAKKITELRVTESSLKRVLSDIKAYKESVDAQLSSNSNAINSIVVIMNSLPDPVRKNDLRALSKKLEAENSIGLYLGIGGLSRFLALSRPGGETDESSAVIEEMNSKLNDISKRDQVRRFNEACQVFSSSVSDAEANMEDPTASVAKSDLKFDDCNTAFTALKDSFARVSSDISDLVEKSAAKIEERLKLIADNISESSSAINNNNTRLSQLVKSSSSEILAGKGLVIDTSAIYVIGLTLFAWTAIIAIIVSSIKYIVRLFAEKEINVKEEFSFILFLEMMTVFLLTGTILILGIAGKLTTEALAALIGGISGYVLGRMHTARQQQKPAAGNVVAGAE